MGCKVLYKIQLSVRWHSPAYCGVSPGVPLPEGINTSELTLRTLQSRAFPEIIIQSHPVDMPESPQLTPFSPEERLLYSGLLPNHQTTEVEFLLCITLYAFTIHSHYVWFLNGNGLKRQMWSLLSFHFYSRFNEPNMICLHIFIHLFRHKCTFSVT